RRPQRPRARRACPHRTASPARRSPAAYRGTRDASASTAAHDRSPAVSRRLRQLTIRNSTGPETSGPLLFCGRTATSMRRSDVLEDSVRVALFDRRKPAAGGIQHDDTADPEGVQNGQAVAIVRRRRAWAGEELAAEQPIGAAVGQEGEHNG